MSDRYTVIFEGRVMPGKNAEMVKDRLKSVLKTDDQGVAKLFVGSPVAVRKNTDLATAEKYKQVFAAAGAFCDIRKDGAAETQAPPSPSGDSAVVADASNESRSAAPPPQPPVSQVKVHYITTSDGGKMIITNIEEARLMGANAIVNVRFSTSSVAQGAAELYAYGTAVRVE